jgi:hypothetical protein
MIHLLDSTTGVRFAKGCGLLNQPLDLRLKMPLSMPMLVHCLPADANDPIEIIEAVA